MAWYAELKRRKWYCINHFDAIRWYSQYLYDEWYNSLTEEQKQCLEENRHKREEQRHKEAQEAIQRLAFMTATIVGISNRDKYRGLYDEMCFYNSDYFN